MTIRRFHKETIINTPAQFAFDWHKKPGAFERLGPAWEELRIDTREGGLKDGGQLVFRFKVAPGIWQKWHARHYDYIEGQQFCDVQVAGPFHRWRHVHRFESLGDESCKLIDDVEYELPLQPLSDLAPRFLVEGKVEAMFAYRAAVTKADIETHYHAKAAPMKIAVTGSGGLVASSLIPFLTTGDHEVVRLVRSPRSGDEASVLWDPMTGVPREERHKLEGMDAVVHLAGESILGLWTKEKKKAIRDSRVVGTRRLCEDLAKLEQKPKLLVCASAIGIYGTSREEELTEADEAGHGFLAEVGQQWENATEAARKAGIRVVNLRIGIVLSPRGGALSVMRLPFSLGLGGRIGDGSNYMSWIALDDLVGLIHHSLIHEEIEGPLNATSPHPVTNAEFARTLGHALERPVFLPVPSGLLRSVLRDAADEMLLSSLRVLPKKAEKSGYEFRFRDLGETLRHLLGRNT